MERRASTSVYTLACQFGLAAVNFLLSSAMPTRKSSDDPPKGGPISYMSKRSGKSYGDVLISYSGRGTITSSDGKDFNCDFSAHQLVSGQVVILVKILDTPSTQFDVVAFSGIENGGSFVTAKGNIRQIHYLPQTPNSSYGDWAAYCVDQLRVDYEPSASELRVFKFGLTNLAFIGIKTRTRTGFHYNEVLLDLKDSSLPPILLQRTRGYEDTILRLKTLRGIHVTAELESPPLSSEMYPLLEQAVTDLCYIFSIASGTKVQWVYCMERTQSRRKIATSHFSRITKPFTLLAPLDLNQSGIIKGFIEKVYPVYTKRRSTFELEKGAVDAYLDAKGETDYLEMRGVKISVAIEALRQIFLDISGNQKYELVLPEATFNPLIENIQQEVCRVLADHAIRRSEVKAIASEGKIGGLNRRSFRYVLSKLCKSLELNLGADTDLFIACRNSLVHRGRFYCKSAKPTDRARLEPPPDAAHEYFFLVNVMDRLYLRLIGYSGPYINWRQPLNPVYDIL